jgi:hypothetical protein
MKTLRNEKGIALVMVLILAAISLSIMTGMIYLITSGTQVSGIQKRYKTALEAGTGGADITYSFVASRGAALDGSLTAAIGLTTTTPAGCQTNAGLTLPDGRTCSSIGLFTGFATKINVPTACWQGCDSTVLIDITNPLTYDLRFNLGTNPSYLVYGKIVDTVFGNSGVDTGLIQGGVVWSKSEFSPPSSPYYYAIEIDSENSALQAGFRERAKLSILYQY